MISARKAKRRVVDMMASSEVIRIRVQADSILRRIFANPTRAGNVVRDALALWRTETVPAPWTHEGFDCAIVRQSELGHLCGYVRIPGGHPLFGVAYDDPVPESLAEVAKTVEDGPIGKRGVMDVFLRALSGEMKAGMLLDVHGGVNFSRAIEAPDDYLPPGFWYGFDCAHADDLMPWMHERYPDLLRFGKRGVYRDVPYVRAECESLARQLADLLAGPTDDRPV